MASCGFEALNDNELIEAFEEYQQRRSGVRTAPGAFDAAMHRVAEHVSDKKKVWSLTSTQLLYTIAQKWYREQRPEGKILEVDEDVWVIQYNEVKMGRVSRIIEKGEGKDYIYWIQPYDEDMDEAYPETMLGTRFFLTEIAAHRFLDHLLNQDS